MAHTSRVKSCDIQLGLHMSPCKELLYINTHRRIIHTDIFFTNTIHYQTVLFVTYIKMAENIAFRLKMLHQLDHETDRELEISKSLHTMVMEIIKTTKGKR